METRIPDSEVGGTYADGITVGYNRATFTLDFIVREDPGSNDRLLVVRRIRLDPTALQGALAVLSRKLDDYEREFGSIS